MSAADIERGKEAYAQARARRSGQGAAYERLRSALHDELRHELCLRAARGELVKLNRLQRTLKTLRETFAFAEAPR